MTDEQVRDYIAKKIVKEKIQYEDIADIEKAKTANLKNVLKALNPDERKKLGIPEGNAPSKWGKKEREHVKQ
jgi:hypothetical protein